MELLECRGGGTLWRIRILQYLTAETGWRSSGFTMAMAVIILKSIDGCVGNEVAEFVRDHLVDELKKLESFKIKDYE